MNAILIAGLLSVALAGQAPSNADESIHVLDAAVDEWRRGLSFYCTFTYRQGTAATFDDGLAGRFGAKIGKPKDEDAAQGVLCKRDEQLRCSIDYGKPPADASIDGSGSQITNVSIDAVCNGAMFLTYFPRRGNFGDSARFARRQEDTVDKLWIPSVGGAIVTPFEFGGGVDGQPLAGFEARPGYEESVTSQVEKVDATHLQVTLRRVSPKEGTYTRMVRFYTGYSPPVIDSITETSQDNAGTELFRSVGRADHFVACGTGMMAKRVRVCSGPVKPSNRAGKVWIAKVWESDDLGGRPPADNDFSIQVPATTQVNGLLTPPPPGASRLLALGDYNVADLAESGLVGPAGTIKPPGANWLLTMIAVVAGVALIVSLAWFRFVRTSPR